MLLKLNAFNTTPTTGWTSFKLTTTGTIVSDIVDRQTALATDIKLTYAGTVWTASASGALTDADHHGIEQNVWDNYNFTAIANTGTATIDGFDIPVGSQWEFQFAAAAANSPARNTSMTVNGVTGTYVNVPQATPMTPLPPVRIVATAVDDGTGRGKFDMTFAGTSINKYISLITVTDVPTIYSVNGDDAVKLGETITWDVALLTPTSATVGGVSLASVTATTGVIPSLADGVILPDYNSQQLTLSDGVDSPERLVYVYPPDGYHYTRIRSISNNVEGNIRYYIADLELDDTITLQNGSELDPPVLVNTVTNDGFIRTDYVGTQTIYRRKFSTGVVTAYQLITSGGIVPPVIVESNVTLQAGRVEAREQLAVVRTKLAYQADSVAATVADLRTDFNSLISKMNTRGWFTGGEVQTTMLKVAMQNGLIQFLNRIKTQAPDQMDVQSASVAADVATLRTDFNALLTKLKAANLMATS